MSKDNFLPAAKNKFDFKEIFFSLRNFFLATQSTLGIDVGNGYIKILQLQKSQGGYILSDYKVRAIPFKIKDNPREKNRFIKEFIDEYISQSRIKTSLGRLAVKGTGVFTFSFLLPPLSDKDLRGAVGIELKKRLPFQLDFKNVSFYYFVTERFEGEPPQLFVTCIAVDNSTLDKHLDFLKSFGLRPVIINTTDDALSSLLKTMEAPPFVAILDMGAKQSHLTFYKDNLLQFTREIPVGGEQFTQGILKALSYLKEDISFEDAESFKRHCGIPMEDEASVDFYTDFGAIKGAQVATSLRPVLDRLITEISRTVSFYFRTYKLDSLDAFYLTGGASRIKNILKFIKANVADLSIKTIEKLNPLQAMKKWLDSGVFRNELVMEEAAPHLTGAFGICMDKGGIINLLPTKEKIEQKFLFFMFLARLIFPIILCIFLGIYSFSYLRLLRFKTRISRVQEQIVYLTPLVEEIKECLSFEKIFLERESLLTRSIGRQPLWWGMLKELSNITPSEVTLYHLEVKGGGSPKKLNISGEVISEYTDLNLAITQYTHNLTNSPYFSKVDLPLLEKDMYSPIPKAIFEISCQLVY